MTEKQLEMYVTKRNKLEAKIEKLKNQLDELYNELVSKKDGTFKVKSYSDGHFSITRYEPHPEGGTYCIEVEGKTE